MKQKEKMDERIKCSRRDGYSRRLLRLPQEFKVCQSAFTAVGDETRQIIVTLLESNCQGIRVGKITKRMHLSRPAVSHHIKMLKDAGIMKTRRESTRNYCFIDYSVSELNKIESLFAYIRELVTAVPECTGAEMKAISQI